MGITMGIVNRALTRPRGPEKRPVRAFGEMVALLCAYPRECFKDEWSTSIRLVCAADSRIIPGYA